MARQDPFTLVNRGAEGHSVSVALSYGGRDHADALPPDEHVSAGFAARWLRRYEPTPTRRRTVVDKLPVPDLRYSAPFPVSTTPIVRNRILRSLRMQQFCR